VTAAQHTLRVVYLDHVGQLSGGELALSRLLAVLPAVEPHVILAEDGPLAARFRQQSVPVEVRELNPRTRQLRKGSVRPAALPVRAAVDTLSYAVGLSRRLRTLRPDVVHTNSLKSGLYGVLAARLAGIPVVWHLRDRLDTDYLPSAAVALMRVAVRFGPDVVITNSAATAQTLARGGRTFVIPSVVEAARPRDVGAARDGALAVGIVGRLAPWKGQDVFLRAFAKAFPHGQERAIVVGAALFGAEEAAYADGLVKLAAELGIADRVSFNGHSDDVSGELRELDVLVHASTTPEPFGQVVVEGMLAGVPVVASRGGGPAEIITDGIDGVLYPPGDVEALAGILTRLDGDPELRGKLAEAASIRAGDFGPERVAELTMQAYADALTARRRGRRARPGSAPVLG
jgi:glycosyltransferase involved in cell wall biosynthesis